MFFDGVIQVLLIEDEEFDVRRVHNTIKPFVDKINIASIASNGKDALDLLKTREEGFDVVIMDFQIAGGLRGESLIQKIKEFDSSLQIIVVTKMTVNLTDYNFANKLLQAGAFWYCTKYPGDIEDYIYQPTDFVISIFNAYEKSRLEKERTKSNQKLKRNIDDIMKQRRIIGKSPLMLKLIDDISKYSDTNISLMIKGASGTGKEIVAYNIHYLSQRKFENFVPINCGSLPTDLVESELFGYEKGAFTGADKKKPGLFEIANNGTVFLDEITELPLSAQVKLLRVIQEGEIEKIGRTEKIKVDVRIIAATNRNIEEEVRAKRFRDDLYYRLNVVPIVVPALKQRKEDIPVLADYFMTRMSNDMRKEKPVIDQGAWDILTGYDWPGNVRELINVVQRFFFNDDNLITCQQAKIILGAYDIHKQSASGVASGIDFFAEGEVVPLKQMEKLAREKYFIYVRQNSISDTEAARKLGLAPPNYHRMAKDLGLK
ncbi:MAG: sigma-54 dependent transcriptional regulator [Ignavibacteria bacterium]